MKNQKKHHARNLYLHTGLSKTEIAARLDVDRKTIYAWIREGAWDRIKRSAEHIPALVAEQCYFLLGHMTTTILSDSRGNVPVTHKEADAIHKLALTINKLKNRNTINESMEMFTFFLEGLKKKCPDVANTILPHVEDFINARSNIYMTDFLPPGFDGQGHIPGPFSEDLAEKKLDEQNYAELYGHAG